ncbi:unnamed protein product [Caenorhabditis angaria]|uniref:Ammonium transporter AmtB-like domain-containing protein n=1 Tax=Caenorhabditis angaria TaxID=860376 RepID=A0A9P1J0M9_9PELO|nr:unnamed protein product [Caenorhabditis angaria]
MSSLSSTSTSTNNFDECLSTRKNRIILGDSENYREKNFSSNPGISVKEKDEWKMEKGYKRYNFDSNPSQFLIFGFQIAFLVIFGLFAEYAPSALPNGAKAADEEARMPTLYPMFQDTHVMIFIGFGFLMTFLKRYGFSAVSINMLLACFTIEWGLIVRGFVGSYTHGGHLKIVISLEQLLTADFAAAVVLISMGAMLGKLSPVQYIIMAFIETPVALIIEHICVHNLKINDVGGSIIVHAFGAYFGLACAKGFGKKQQRGHDNEGSTYHTDIFAMVGAVFLWIYWPSFNAAVAATADARQRAVANTFLSLCSSTMTTFLMSQLLDKHRRFEMVHIANSTLAGGVAIGTTANVVLEPFHAMLIGSLAGIVSVIGYKYLTPFLSNKLGIHDTCGVNNLHGMPGLMAGIASAIFLFVYEESRYGQDYSTIYSGMTRGADGSRAFDEKTQAINQLLAIGLVLLSSIITGYVTGFLLKIKIWDQVRDAEYFADADYFETPGDYDFTSRIITSIDRVDVAEYQPLTQKDV